MIRLTTMNRSYLGGIVRRGCFDGLARCFNASGPASTAHKRHVHGDYELFLQARSDNDDIETLGQHSVLLRGYATPTDTELGGTGRRDLLRNLLGHYRRHQELPVERLDGSFTIMLVDGEAGRILLYRNIVGTGFTYYTETPEGLIWGSNLADLVENLQQTPTPNTEVLPAYFLFRFVPGRETLFKNIFRLMPGELLRYDARGLRRSQRLTIGGLRGELSPGADPSELVDHTIGQILADFAAHRPGAVNLLSGGVDSSYIQAHWNRLRPATDEVPETFTASVDHPHTRVDDDYAVSAAKALGTKHTLVTVDQPIADCLTETIAGTGEPTNHVQTGYFRFLARQLAARGVDASICGEGADSLFGVGSTVTVQMAMLVRRLLPARPFREIGATLAQIAGHPRLPAICRLASQLDDVSALDHPLNEVAVFTNLDSVNTCFGAAAVAAGFAHRRKLLDQYRISDDLRERVNFVGFLGEALDGASLWTTLFELEDCDMLCPFLDSRMIRLVVSLDPEKRYPFRNPKGLLKRALSRQGHPMLADRSKRGFGQPILEWMAPGGQLRPLVEQIGRYEFIAPDVLAACLRKPDWFLYSLLCYDVWHKCFIDRIAPESFLNSPVSTA